MDIGFAGFDWDEGNRAKCQKHGVSIAEIEAMLLGRPSLAPAPKRSASEDRFIALGKTPAGRTLFVALTFRNKGGEWLIRQVSARYIHKKEIEAYEKKSS